MRATDSPTIRKSSNAKSNKSTEQENRLSVYRQSFRGTLKNESGVFGGLGMSQGM